jgi:hypothetical protein
MIRIPGTVHTKIITEFTYGRSLYGWKNKRIIFRMDLVSRLNTFLFHGKRQNNEAYRMSGCCLAIFWPDGLCIELCPIGACPRVVT